MTTSKSAVLPGGVALGPLAALAALAQRPLPSITTRDVDRGGGRDASSGWDRVGGHRALAACGGGHLLNLPLGAQGDFSIPVHERPIRVEASPPPCQAVWGGG